jgi:hypothetical protein
MKQLMTMMMGTVILVATSGCAQFGPGVETMPAYVEGYKTFIQ